MNEESSKTPSIAPYLPFAILLNFLGKVKETVLPPEIDSRLARNLSGNQGGALMSALRFLDLIDPDGRVTDKMEQLVLAYKTESWKTALTPVVTDSYKAIVGDLDLATSTQAMLQQRFEKNTSAKGQVIEKGKRFYLAALAEIGAPVSPHLKARKTRTNGPRKAVRKRPDNTLGTETPKASAESNAPPAGMRVLRLPVPGKEDVKFFIPEDLSNDDWGFLKPIFEAYLSRMLAPTKVVATENGGAT